jgi:starch-binding outer membrane protein, SusD/RagB family
LVYRNPVNDVYTFIEKDLTYAYLNLPLPGSGWEKGRLTTWSAQGMLSKVYVTYAGFGSKGNGLRNQDLLDSAKLYAGNVCKNSGLSLLNNYADLFKTKFNDNAESLFALQWAPGAGWLEGNMLQIYSSGSTEISANGQAGWYAISPTYDLFKQYSPKDSVRRKATFMLQGDYYPELNTAGGGYTYKGSSGLKKHIIGTNVDNSAPTMTLTSSIEHNSLLRLADVYLIYAEAILGNSTSTTNADALFYFNKVRIRAGVAPVTSLNADDLLKERRIELAAESHFWADLVRLSYYNPEKAKSILNTQERITFTYDKGTVTKGSAYGEVSPATDNTFVFPLPSAELTANPKLSEPPVPYSF